MPKPWETLRDSLGALAAIDKLVANVRLYLGTYAGFEAKLDTGGDPRIRFYLGDSKLLAGPLTVDEALVWLSGFDSAMSVTYLRSIGVPAASHRKTP